MKPPRLRRGAHAATLLLAAATAHADGPGGTLAGQVTSGGKPRAGVAVSVYADSHATLREDPAAVTTTDKDGRYRVAMAPGVYFVLAREGNGGQVIAYPGGNPLSVLAGQETRAQLVLVRGGETGPRRLPQVDGDATGIRGVVLDGEAGVADAWVMAYADTAQGFHGPGVAQGVTDRDGLFFLELPPGTYFLLARKRLRGGRVGPLQDGDRLGYFHGNPVAVAERHVVDVALATYRLPARNKDHLPVHAAISGTLVDRAGKPVRGGLVLVFVDRSEGAMPVAASPPTGRDGRFTVRLNRGGKYFLLARTALGGPPARGELMARYDDGADGVLDVQPGGKVKGLKLVMQPAE